MKQLIILSFLAAAIFVSCNGGDAGKETKQQLVVASTDAAEKFQCPMKCQSDTSYTTAGACPVCEMDLAKIE